MSSKKYSKKGLTSSSTKKSSSSLRSIIVILIILMFVVFIATISLMIIEFGKLENNYDTEFQNSSEGTNLQNDERLMVLVDEDHPLPDNFVLNLSSYNNISCDTELITNFNNLKSAAGKAGFDLTITKGFVDKTTQQRLHDELVNNLIANGYTKVKAENEASKTEPKGGCSDLQTGFVVDINKNIPISESDFASSAEYRWLYDNCVYYGFILRYPQSGEDKTFTAFNPCRYRYVGKENAVKMRALNMSFEEYYEYLLTQKSN